MDIILQVNILVEKETWDHKKRNNLFDFQSKTIKEFDANFTSKHFGFEDVEHYYRTATLHDKLHKITTPILCLSAADDPFQPLDGTAKHNRSLWVTLNFWDTWYFYIKIKFDWLKKFIFVKFDFPYKNTKCHRSWECYAKWSIHKFQPLKAKIQTFHLLHSDSDRCSVKLISRGYCDNRQRWSHWIFRRNLA